MLKCNPALYHYNGFCFNKSRIPENEIAITEEECKALDIKEEEVTTIID